MGSAPLAVLLSFSDSGYFTGPVLASIDTTGVVSVAEVAASALSISFDTSTVPIGFGQRVSTLAVFAFGTLEEVKAATFLFPLAFGPEKNNQGRQTQ